MTRDKVMAIFHWQKRPHRDMGMGMVMKMKISFSVFSKTVTSPEPLFLCQLWISIWIGA